MVTYDVYANKNIRARLIIGNIGLIGKYRYRLIGSGISNIGIIGIGIGICYNYIIYYIIGIVK